MLVKPKILAPAGSPETLQAVLDCGADEVYIGGRCFSARQNATNFSIEEIKAAADRCHLYGAKLHVAVNTLILDSQLDEFAKYIESIAEAKVDALIVQDLGALETIKRVAPDMELHASTQMSIHSVSGAMLMQELGFKRVVLSRELDRETIANICALDIDTEVFVHGALCMSVSGQCYMSAMIGSRSANRGLCGQPCRLPFSACNDKEACALSLKDMSLIEHAQELIDLGVTSLKIEGRMKRPEYSACAVSTLRTALDGYEPDMKTLRSVFSRGGFTDGYYTGKRDSMFGVRSKEDVVSAEDVLPKVRESYRSTRKVSTLNFSLELEEGKPATLIATDEMCSYSIVGNVPQQAINRPLTRELAEKQMSKLGGTIYSFGGLNYSCSGNLTLSASELNGLRRDMVSRIDSDRVHRNQPIIHVDSSYSIGLPNSIPTVSNPRLWLRLRDFNQLQGIDVSEIDRVVMPLDEVVKREDIPTELRSRLVVQPPRYVDSERNVFDSLTVAYKMGVRHLMCNNLMYVMLGNRLGYTLHGDYGLNVLNSLTLETLQRLHCVDSVVSFELKLSQVEGLHKTMPIGVEAYGNLPLMLVRNCPIRNEVGCSRCKHYISDRTNRKFPVYCNTSKQYSEVFNAETMCIADVVDTLHNVDYYVLSFLYETSDEVAKVLEDFRLRKKFGTTKGLYVRGII